MCAVVEALIEGEIPRSGGLRPSVERHLESCAGCRAAVEELLGPGWRDATADGESQGEPEPTRTGAAPVGRESRAAAEGVCEEELDRICHRVAARLRSDAWSLEEEQAVAGEELLELLALPSESRLPALEATPDRYRSPLLVDLLLEESRSSSSDAPQRAFDLAGLAQQICLRLEDHRLPLPMAMDSVLLARALRADALRATGDLTAADRRFRALEPLLPQGTNDPMVLAEVDVLLAALRRDEQRLADADECLERAEGLYASVGDGERMGRVLIERARLAHRGVDPERALELLDRAIHQLSPFDDPRLELLLGHHRALYLCDLDRPAEAAAELARHTELERQAGDDLPLHRVCLPWLSGRIALGLGRPAAAIGPLESALDTSVAEGGPYEEAMAMVDLANAFVQARREDELRALLARIPSERQTGSLGAEALSALTLLRRAAAAGDLTPSAAGEIRRLLQGLRFSRASRPEEPS